MSEIEELLKRKIERERAARLEAEQILERKSYELYESNLQLQNLIESLESEVEKRTAEIKESENNLFILFEKHPFPMIVYDINKYIIFGVNQTALTKYGYSREQFLNMKIEDLHVEEDIPKLAAHLKNVHDNNYKAQEWRHQTKDGRIIDVEINGISLEYDNRAARLVVIIDITDKKRIELEKKENEQKYQDLVENASDFIYRISEDGIITYINPTAIHALGYSKEEIIGEHFTRFTRPDYHGKVFDFFAQQKDQKIASTHFEFPILAKGNKIIWISQTTDSHFLPGGKMEFIALSRDITERRQVQDALRRSEEKYRNIMENMELGLLEVDVNGIVTNAYPKFCDLSGYSKEELIGVNAAERMLPPDFADRMRTETNNRKNGESGVYEVQLRRKDGKCIWVIISGAPYYDQYGDLAGKVGIHLDISERKDVEQKLEEAILIAENSIKSKELFMANMSHEIRTPMNAIIGMGELLQKTNLDSKQNSYVDAIQTSADNLLIIINDILDFSKIESGKLSLELIPGDLKGILQTSIKTIELKAEEKGLSVQTEIDHSLSSYSLDPTRLNQVLINLLSNAVKFTSQGSVKLTCKIKESDPEKDTLYFEVKDTGIGIKPDKLETIFESFIQAEESTTRQYGGTGLGLAISKQLVALMGGTLEVDSQLDIGSVFYFTLTFSKTTTPIKEEAMGNNDHNQVNGLNILLVEDNDINRFMALTILEAWECNTDTAIDGEEAIDLIKKNDYDIVLMDVRMPRLDGISATRIIRNELKLELPIIALTANAIKGDNEACIEAGMNGYISKPFQQSDLLEVLMKYGGDGLRKNTRSKPSGSKSDIIDGADLIDLTNLRATTNNDAAFMNKMFSSSLRIRQSSWKR